MRSFTDVRHDERVLGNCQDSNVARVRVESPQIGCACAHLKQACQKQCHQMQRAMRRPMGRMLATVSVLQAIAALAFRAIAIKARLGNLRLQLTNPATCGVARYPLPKAMAGSLGRWHSTDRLLAVLVPSPAVA